MKIPIELFPQEVIEEYDLMKLVHNGFIFMEIRKGMYGLPQAGTIANKQLQEHLAKYGYYPVTHTPDLWHYSSSP